MGTSHGQFFKFPRTPHLFDSRGTDDDRHLDDDESLEFIGDESLVVTEKIDGTNTGIHFDDDGELVLQCRGHLITEGMHRQYDMFKSWTRSRQDLLFDLLATDYILFGEWAYAKHTVFYNSLSHYFLAFDLFDKRDEIFLATESFEKMLDETGIISSPIVHLGPLKSSDEVEELIGTSLYGDELAEGVYLKREAHGMVVGRGKYVHPTFIERLEATGEHWSKGKLIPNELDEGVDIWN